MYCTAPPRRRLRSLTMMLMLMMMISEIQAIILGYDDCRISSPNLVKFGSRPSETVWVGIWPLKTTKRSAETSITQPHISNLSWNLTCWCNMRPGRIKIVKIHFRSNPRRLTAPKFDYLNCYKSAADYSVSVTFDVRVRYGSLGLHNDWNLPIMKYKVDRPDKSTCVWTACPKSLPLL